MREGDEPTGPSHRSYSLCTQSWLAQMGRLSDRARVPLGDPFLHPDKRRKRGIPWEWQSGPPYGHNVRKAHTQPSGFAVGSSILC